MEMEMEMEWALPIARAAHAGVVRRMVCVPEQGEGAGWGRALTKWSSSSAVPTSQKRCGAASPPLPAALLAALRASSRCSGHVRRITHRMDDWQMNVARASRSPPATHQS
jgi:hypothetical protein